MTNPKTAACPGTIQEKDAGARHPVDESYEVRPAAPLALNNQNRSGKGEILQGKAASLPAARRSELHLLGKRINRYVPKRRSGTLHAASH